MATAASNVEKTRARASERRSCLSGSLPPVLDSKSPEGRSPDWREPGSARACRLSCWPAATRDPRGTQHLPETRRARSRVSVPTRACGCGRGVDFHPSHSSARAGFCSTRPVAITTAGALFPSTNLRAPYKPGPAAAYMRHRFLRRAMPLPPPQPPTPRTPGVAGGRLFASLPPPPPFQSRRAAEYIPAGDPACGAGAAVVAGAGELHPIPWLEQRRAHAPPLPPPWALLASSVVSWLALGSSRNSPHRRSGAALRSGTTACCRRYTEVLSPSERKNALSMNGEKLQKGAVLSRALIGIDIEEKKRKTAKSILSLAQRYFTPPEVDYLAEIPDPDAQQKEFITMDSQSSGNGQLPLGLKAWKTIPFIEDTLVTGTEAVKLIC
ncbi:hypothetical protein PR202_gb25468 [Eleusine coracana subsp. coracana]|uniref:Uncharacterized protein n=1 Tax=Eleusine coracana subsp. coracana TaxID=191504 RepID=A0AAV5FP76_ELECO|nr:hypothetical protein PR202_gb25468 [Eleusine coracana subsp. coracana]